MWEKQLRRVEQKGKNNGDKQAPWRGLKWIRKRTLKGSPVT